MNSATLEKVGRCRRDPDGRDEISFCNTVVTCSKNDESNGQPFRRKVFFKKVSQSTVWSPKSTTSMLKEYWSQPLINNKKTIKSFGTQKQRMKASWRSSTLLRKLKYSRSYINQIAWSGTMKHPFRMGLVLSSVMLQSFEQRV